MTLKAIECKIEEIINSYSTVIDDANDKIWNFAETSLEEFNSSKCLKDELSKYGFEILDGAKDTPTSFIAQWGSGKPCIGFLAEYDALPGLSQAKATVCQPLEEGKPGHGCGHNTLAAGILGTVIAVKELMISEKLHGTIRFYGCPAEETLIGKVRMSRDHLFDDCDVALTWHPNDISYVWARKSIALLSLKYRFSGKTAHAALDPWNGRSALDAVELMNVGANYLREHIPTTWRMHYVTTNGGLSPNIVPKEAEVWYNLRAEDRQQVEQLHQRLKKIADGAAMMTETLVEEEFLSGCYDFMPNMTLAGLVLDCMQEIGTPKWTEEDKNFSRAISDHLSSDSVDSTLKQFSFEKSDEEDGLITKIYNGFYKDKIMGASTDVGDVSWQIPVGCFSGAASIVGAPGHSWFYTATGCTGIAHRGAYTAAKVLALASYRILTEPELIEASKKELEQSTKNIKYSCLL